MLIHPTDNLTFSGDPRADELRKNAATQCTQSDCGGVIETA